MGIAASYESELPMLQEEISQLQRQYILTEGFFKDIKDKFMGFVNKLQNIIKVFYEKIIIKFLSGIKKIANISITDFFNALGLEITGKVNIKTPRW